jgi:D-xylose transport system substrate-binding protein
MINRKLTVVAFSAILVAAACAPGASVAPSASTGGVTETAPPASVAPEQCIVGVSWNNFQQPRWAAKDRPSMQRTVVDGGGVFIDFDANLSNTQQVTDVQTLINQGADVIVLLSQDDTAGAEVVKLASDNGIPVIAYDRLVDDPNVLYITFDNANVGREEAKAMLAKVPEGNYVLIKGHPGDKNASTFLPQGWDEAGLKAAVDSGKIKILADQFTDDWNTTKAQNNMEAIIDAANQSGDKIDAVLAENDSTALGVVQALKAKSYEAVPVSGQDGDTANLQNVAAGYQYVDVWKDSNQLGKAAGAAALQLCEGKTIPEVVLPDGVLDAASAPDNLAVQDFTTPGGNAVKSIVLKVQPITQENLQNIIDAKWLTKEQLCANAAAGPTPWTGCQ